MFHLNAVIRHHYFAYKNFNLLKCDDNAKYVISPSPELRLARTTPKVAKMRYIFAMFAQFISRHTK
jgi:hypothetical protein